MTAWLKITRPNVEVGGNFVIYQTVIIDLERATGFAMQNATNVAFFVDGKTFVVQQPVGRQIVPDRHRLCPESHRAVPDLIPQRKGVVMAATWLKYQNNDNATVIFNLDHATHFRHVAAGDELFVEVYADGTMHSILQADRSRRLPDRDELHRHDHQL